jgi:hypothetical protein
MYQTTNKDTYNYNINISLEKFFFKKIPYDFTDESKDDEHKK